MYLLSYKCYSYLPQFNAGWPDIEYGLCEPWGDIDKCEEEELRIPQKQAIGISFTKIELTIENTFICIAHVAYVSASQRSADLGYRTWLNNHANVTFVDMFGETIERMAGMTKRYRPTQELVLMVEYAENQKLIAAAWKALGDVPVDVKVPAL